MLSPGLGSSSRVRVISITKSTNGDEAQYVSITRSLDIL